MKNNIKKHNALTDAKTRKLSLKSDKLINALYSLYEEHGEKFEITMTELRDLLELKGSNYSNDIEARLKQLRDHSIKFRNVKISSGNYSYYIDSFIHGFGIDRETQNICTIKISESFIEAFKQKMGYTLIELEISNQFKSKYGLKLYEMYLRYYSLPNNEGKGVGKISKSINELNEMFGTSYGTPSEMKRGLDRGVKEIENITNESISCFYNKAQKKFIFGWHQEDKHPLLRIPYDKIEVLIDWYLHHNQDKLKIKSLERYREHLKKAILIDEFEELDKYYRGLLQWKFNVDWEDSYDRSTGVYGIFNT